MNITGKDHIQATIEFVDHLFGEGMGVRHLRFLERLENRALREMIVSYHAIEADERWLTVQENYLLGLCTLCATQRHDTAAMFAKVARHVGVPREKILEAVGRLGMWIGGLAAAEATFVIQRAVADYDTRGLESLALWFPLERD